MSETVHESSFRVASRIKRARREAGLTMRQLGDLIGLDTRTVAGYEARPPRTHPSYAKLARIAEATGKSMAWFFEEEDEAA